jgi:hypothetical protein
MKNKKFIKLLLPIGLLLLGGSVLINLFVKIPSFIYGFLLGLSIVFIVAGFIFKMKEKRSGI